MKTILCKRGERENGQFEFFERARKNSREDDGHVNIGEERVHMEAVVFGCIPSSVGLGLERVVCDRTEQDQQCDLEAHRSNAKRNAALLLAFAATLATAWRLLWFTLFHQFDDLGHQCTVRPFFF
jgi:hypothetical protein